jgi:aerobic carbon-monoxide dehydrogenase medium subunit
VKPPPFVYHAPTTVEEAVGVLAEAGDSGAVLAGGQSLVPLLNMRLATPEHLVDINRVGELSYVRTEGGGVRVGALARHAEVERDAAVAGTLPLLPQALAHVAHPVIRNRGTVCGSLAHADPAGELGAVLALAGGTVRLARAGHPPRDVPAGEFFVGPLMSAKRPGELVVSAYFPAPPERTGTAFVEVSRRHGDYALAGVAAAVTATEDGRVAAARAGYVSLGPTPIVLDLTEAVEDKPLATADWAPAGVLAAAAVEPDDDIHAGAAYRRHLAGVLTVRALSAAAVRALETTAAATRAATTEAGP